LFDNVSFFPKWRLIFNPDYVPEEFEMLSWDLLTRSEMLAVKLDVARYSEATLPETRIQVRQVSIIELTPRLARSTHEYTMVCTISEPTKPPEAPCPDGKSVYSCHHIDRSNNLPVLRPSVHTNASNDPRIELAAATVTGIRTQAIAVRRAPYFERYKSGYSWGKMFVVGQISFSRETELTYEAERDWVDCESVTDALQTTLDMAEMMRDSRPVPGSPALPSSLRSVSPVVLEPGSSRETTTLSQMPTLTSEDNDPSQRE
jgi:hypothetical protein